VVTVAVATTENAIPDMVPANGIEVVYMVLAVSAFQIAAAICAS